MTAAEREAAVGSLLSEARNPRSGARAEVNARIRAFENRYEMSSKDMRRRLAAGEIRETAEIAEWLFYLASRDCFAAA